MPTPTELDQFMSALDAALAEPARLVVIGGTAAALAYGFDRATRDIDTFDSPQEVVRVAFERAREVTGTRVYMDKAAISCPPWDWEERLVRVRPELAKLQLFVPEAHDLVLLKFERAAPPDLALAVSLRAQGLLSAETLISRYRDEMGHCIGDVHRRRELFVYALEHVFGGETASWARRLLR